jgi:hypothetical protein
MKSKRKELIKNTFKKNKSDWDESYYYLTNDKFKNLGKIRVDKSENIEPKNKIEGIGLIKNKPETKKYYKVHMDGNTNRYIYIGNYFIEREIIDDYNAPLVYALEEILFKGKTHSKRGAGLTRIPESVLKLDVCQGINIKREIKELFIYHFRDKLIH